MWSMENISGGAITQTADIYSGGGGGGVIVGVVTPPLSP